MVLSSWGIRFAFALAPVGGSVFSFQFSVLSFQLSVANGKSMTNGGHKKMANVVSSLMYISSLSVQICHSYSVIEDTW